MKKRKQMIILIIASAVLLGALVFFASLISSGLSRNHSTSKFPVQIQEYMSSNTLYPNENGVCADWVELYNSSDADIDIGGFKLTDESRKSRYTVPAGTVLPAHGYYVIYCLKSAGSDYADFGISRSGGEELLLLNRKNVLIDAVSTISLPENASAERDGNGEFRVSMQPSPGAASITAWTEHADSETVLKAEPGQVILSEIVPGNTLYADERGVAGDLVELFNTSGTRADIGGYVLQDGVDGTRFVVPEGTVIEPGGFYVVHCVRAQGEDAYADFAISRNGGETILLYTADGELTDYITTEYCGKNGAVARVNGAVSVVSYSTPGFANTEEGYYECLEAYSVPDGFVISEIMASNQSYIFPDGTVPDWVELKNETLQSADLSGWGLSDTASTVRYVFPEGTVLEPGAYLVIACDGNAGTSKNAAHFGLSYAGGETVFLTRPDGTLCFAAVTVPTEAETSMVYDGGIRPFITDHPTPGFSNDESGLEAYLDAKGTGATGLVISEFMPKNTCTAAFAGSFPDWIELHNESGKAINLSAFCLSDKETDPAKFRLPDRTLEPGAYVLVLCGRSASASEGGIVAPFGLSGKGGGIYLSSVSGGLVDKAIYDASDDDRSYQRTVEGIFELTDCPTPGFANTAEGYRSFLTSRIPEGLYISEVMPANRTVARNNGDYFDWIELCNGSSEPLRLNGLFLTDDYEAPEKYALPDITLESGEYILIYCSGNPSLTGSGAYHCPFQLNGGEDRVYLFGSNGKLLDYMHIYRVPSEGSIGRQSRESGISYYEKPTPKKKNSGGTEAGLISAMPTADKASGVYENTGSFFVSLSASGTIYYTTDGSRPTAKSRVYAAPIEVKKTGVIRAAALEKDKTLSDVLTLAYTVNEGHELPVLNLVMDPDDFSGSKRGIYSNPLESWQRDACIVYTDGGGTVTHDCGVRISGQHSRGRPQKSFKLVFSDQYGGRLYYDIFGETCEQKSFPELLLRSGLDSKYGIYREPLAQKLALPYRDTTFVQDSVPIVVYINGTYYGIYQFMESLGEETLADRMGISPDSITLYKGYLYPEHSYLEIYQLLQYVKTHDMKKAEYYEYAKAHLAFEDLIDWAIFEAYCRNTDVSANIRYFTSSETDGRWHFVLYDLECGFVSEAGFDLVLGSGQTAVFLKELLKNSEFKDMFLRRLAYHCENTFRQEDVLALLYRYDELIRPETKRHFLRWDLEPVTYSYNFNQIERLIKADRVKQLKQSAKKLLKLTNAEYNAYFGS